MSFPSIKLAAAAAAAAAVVTAKAAKTTTLHRDPRREYKSCVANENEIEHCTAQNEVNNERK